MITLTTSSEKKLSESYIDLNGELEKGAIGTLEALRTLERKLQDINPSFTKHFGTHTFYQRGGGGGGVEQTSQAISETVASMNVKFCRVLETYLKVLEMLKLFT